MTLKLYVSDMVGYGSGPAANTDYWGTETWTEIGGLMNFELHRMSGANASWMECKVARSDLPADIGQRVLISDSDEPVTVNVLFVGRIDETTPGHDNQLGQVWTLRARDYVAVLQDNYVESEGRDRYSKAAFGTSGGVFAEFGYADSWEPVWSPDQTSGVLTGARGELAAQLAMNFVDIPSGIRYVNLQQIPTSVFAGAASVQRSYNLKGVSNKRISDAIMDLLKDDPWLVAQADFNNTQYTTQPGRTSIAGSPSSTDLIRADGVTEIPGIGSECIMDYNPPIGAQVFGNSLVTATPGVGGVDYVDKQVRYAMPYLVIFARGVYNFDPAISFWYGDQSGSRWPILSYQFPKEGTNLYSRGKLVGRSTAQDNNRPNQFLKTASAPSGQGSFWRVSPDYAFGGGGYTPDNDDEVTWLPGSDHYAMRRAGVSNDEGLGAETNEEFTAGAEVPTDKSESARLRAIRMSKTPANLRPLVRGSITVPGLPRDTSGKPLVPGVVINVNIGPLFISNTFYIVDSYSFNYPENTTTIQLARRPWDELTDQLKKMHDFAMAAGSHGKSSLDSGWMIAPPNRSVVITHRWGQVPTSITVLCAEQDGSKVDASGNPVPKVGTEVELPPASTYDPNNGAWVGGAHFSATRDAVSVSFAGQMIYSDGAGRWLTAGTDLIRVILRG